MSNTQPPQIDFDHEDAILEKHSVRVAGHLTSVSLERLFWRHLKQLADRDGISLNELIRRLDEARGGSLSGALRVYVLRQLAADHRSD